MFIIIAGPTGTGKSETAIMAARKIGGEIVSADSMQVYKGMDIGTSKIPPGEAEGIPHYMISITGPEDVYSAARFKRAAEKIMDSIKKRGKVPVIAGGTGLYIHSIIRGLFEAPEPGTRVREKLRALEKEKGVKYLYNMLKRKDPDEGRVIDRSNPRRVIRALEIIETAGEKVSKLKKTAPGREYKDRYYFFVLKAEREKLRERIDKRADEMMERGLIDEVKALRKKGIDESAPSMQAIGYKEALAYIKGRISMTEAARRIKINTRKYAKRQATWFKKYKEAEWIDVTSLAPAGAADIIVKRVKEKEGG